jgi:hypothetical protein
LTLKGEGAKVVIAVDVFDDKARLFKQEFHLGTLEEVEVGGDYCAVDRAMLVVLIVKMGQLEQVTALGGGGTDQVSEYGAIFAPPGSLVQELTAEVLHVTGVGVADINDERAASGEMFTDRDERLLLGFARGEMRKRPESHKRKTEFLREL